MPEASLESFRSELVGWLEVNCRLRCGPARRSSSLEVTDVTDGPRRCVSQAFCSAPPVAYSDLHRRAWASFAREVLEGAYEATLLAGPSRRAVEAPTRFC